MPWITINMLEGHSESNKRRLHKDVTAAVAGALDIPQDWVRIQIIDMKPIDNSIGGVTIDRLCDRTP
jgi:4-oxalocrotonate tautomerase family enzyme